jgi:predicted lipid-binding transport protein (Tim44 family)
MKHFSLFALTLALGLALTVPDAEARRLGGGMSSGMKRDSSLFKRDTTPTPAQAPGAGSSIAQRPAQAGQAGQAMAGAAKPASGMSRWLGPIAGLAAGLGLAALFSHLGLGAEMGTVFMLLLAGVAVILVVRFLLRRMSPQPAAQAATGHAAPLRFEPTQQPLTTGQAANASPAHHGAVPADFDTDAFLRQAKLNFIRLQAANDASNLDDIRAFTTPEMFAEIRLQFQERGNAAQETDVVALEAALVDVTTDGNQQIASVHFSGTIREEAGAQPTAFDEVWHLARPRDGRSGWVIAGIQQTH